MAGDDETAQRKVLLEAADTAVERVNCRVRIVEAAVRSRLPRAAIQIQPRRLAPAWNAPIVTPGPAVGGIPSARRRAPDA